MSLRCSQTLTCVVSAWSRCQSCELFGAFGWWAEYQTSTSVSTGTTPR